VRDRTSPDDEHYILVARALLAGEVIAFLGAGVNLLSLPGGGGASGRQTALIGRPGGVNADAYG
jgi:hypothetical protein